jgi:hypothetical protein
MTENDYILATEVARIQAAKLLLNNVMSSDRVPGDERRSVLEALTRWEVATYEAIERAHRF